jgi:D-amino peptidase
MRLYISADIEGIVHVTSEAHILPAGFEYDSARRWMTETVLATVESAHEQGCTEIVVSDSHGNGHNILPDSMPDYVQLVRGWPRPLSMMQGIELGSYDGAMLIGYHTGGMSAAGNMAHNFSGQLQQVKVNGEIFTETSVSAAIAGEFNVPVMLVSGDNVYCEEARAILGEVEAVEVKAAPGRHCSLNPSTKVAHQRIRDGVARALNNRSRYSAFTASGPLEVELMFRKHLQVEVLSMLPNVERFSAHEVRLTVPNILDLTAFIEFLGNYDLAKFR